MKIKKLFSDLKESKIEKQKQDQKIRQHNDRFWKFVNDRYGKKAGV